MKPPVRVSTSFCHASCSLQAYASQHAVRPIPSLRTDRTGMTKTACAFRPPSPIISPSLPASWPSARPRQSTATIPETPPRINAPENQTDRESTDTESMETQTGTPLFPGIHALLACIFTSLYATFPCRACSRGEMEEPAYHSPNRHPHPDECGQTFVAGSDTNVRPMRHTFRPQRLIPSYNPAPIRPPLRPHFGRSPNTKCPPMRPDFRSCFRYSRAANATNSRYKKLRFSYDFGRISYEHAPLAPVFTATKSLQMRPPSPSWLRYNHETNQTVTTPNRPQWPAACILDPSHQHLRYLYE